MQRLVVLAAALAGLAGCGAADLTPAACPAPAASQAPAPVEKGGDRVTDELARKVLIGGGIDPEKIECNSRMRWDPTLSGYATEIVRGVARHWGVDPDPARFKAARHHALGYLVRSYFNLSRPHNLGVLRLKGMTSRDAGGALRPLMVFRSAVICSGSGESRCLDSLLRHGRVKHVVNLYEGTFPFQDMIDRERGKCGAAGASHFNAKTHADLRWRPLIEEPGDYEKNRVLAMRRVARLIREQFFRPGGERPRGNLYLHCGGGMHRSGMLFGILRRCVNGDPADMIEREYRRHVDYRSEKAPGGFEPLNLRFIREFDCALISNRP